MTTALGWIFFVGFWCSVALNILLLIVDIRVAAAFNEARDILLTVQEQETGEVREIISDFLRETDR